ncbi:ABC transporter substrate-binding protein [Aliikangiella coralliicola]|uniref:ABC transporter substrate-binding protein n=1 Tax=Aliikangiella coralliicola TaxID=2592383 RepID=A0A545U7F6_9GAMM|nr:ABC transporter substrate-binding protein [Aliikangiella coralliicola]TQV85394.1 ABC transporter substrate-binding protein [Aliikangiella coralliicola]
MQTKIFTIIIFCYLTINLIACSSSDSNQNQPLQPDVVADQIKTDAINIGSIAARPSRRDAILLAVKQINDSGGVLNKELNAVTTIRRNVTDSVQFALDMVNAGIEVIQVSGSSRSTSITETLSPLKKLIISESATSPSITDFIDDDYLFRLAPSDIYQGRVLAELAANAGASTAVIVINEDDIFGSDLALQFQQNFELLGGSVIQTVEIPSTTLTDFSPFLGTIYDQQPDVIMNAMLLPEFAANQINAAVQINFNGFYLFPDTIAGKPEFVNNLVDLSLVENARGASSGFGLENNTEFQFFKQSFIAQFNLEPQTFNVTAYDYAMITALAIEKAGYDNNTDSPNGEQIRNSLRSVMNPPGIKLGPSDIGQALSLIRQGQDVDYSGAYSDTDWDNNGDIFGDVVYNIFLLDAQLGDFIVSGQVVVNIPEPASVVPNKTEY